MAADLYRCPTPCDDDCELNDWGCHEFHDEPKRREHDAEACEARMLAGNLRSLLDAGWSVRLKRHQAERAEPKLEPFTAILLQSSREAISCAGVGPGEVLARAVTYATEEPRR